MSEQFSFEPSQSLQILINNVNDESTIQQIINFEAEYLDYKEDDRHMSIYSLFDVIDEEYTGKIIRLLGYLGDISKPVPIEIENNKGKIERISTTKITIKDFGEYELLCPYLSFNEFKKKIELARKANTYLIFEGTIVSQLDANYQRYFFYLKNIYSKITPLDLIRERDYSEEDLKGKIEYYNNKSEKGIRSFIKDELIEKLNISGIENAPELSKAIDFMILQSLSRGVSSDNRYCNKLHSLIIGAPASGKKLLTIIAKILNPIALEISSTDSKVTPAGLIGRVMLREYGPISKPGYLPLASNGVLCIQDFHELSKLGSKQKIFPILSLVMEDGVAIDSTSAMTRHTAITSLHIDMNRLSQVYGKNKNDSDTSDLGIPKNVISRFDFIMDIPTNIQRQFDIIMKMTEGEKELLSAEHNYNLPEWAQTLKRMVAYMATKYDSANISLEDSDYIKTKLNKLLNDNITLKSLEVAGDIVSTRIPISIEKYAKAIACSKLKSKVETDDIDEAFSFIDFKIKFLANYKFNETNVDKRATEKYIRQKKLKEFFKYGEFTKDDLDNFLLNNPKLASKRTLERDIEDLISGGILQRLERGKYQFIEME